MKILIVDDNAYTKCAGIIEECKKRDIEVEIAISSKQAIFIIYLDKGKTLDGIILDMELPLFPYNKNIKEREGEYILRELSRKQCYIPTLVFSEAEMNVNYVQVFDQMKSWEEESQKFFAFLEKLQKDKELREEQERLKLEEEEQLKKEEQLT